MAGSDQVRVGRVRERNMAYCEPSDIKEARDLLREFERTTNHSMRVRKFEDALELLDSYLPENNSQAGRIAANLRLTYAKKLLEQLPSLHFLDFNDWFSYSVLLLTKLKNEIDGICFEHKDSEDAFNAFIKIWANEAIALIQRHFPKT
jgi:hypothetical protein